MNYHQLSFSRLSFIPFLFIFLSSYCQNNPSYKQSEFGTYFEEFPNQKDLMDFLDVKTGDKIADIGSDDAHFTLALTILYDNITLYAEDIDPKRLNEKKFNKQVKHFTKLRGRPQTNELHFSVGTYSTTNLPDNTFDKIIMMAAFHEFTLMDEMISDISKKLKQDGCIYIMEAFSLKDKTIYCADKHKGYRIDEVIAIMTKHGFYLTQIRSPEGSVPNYANALRFERGKKQSQIFFNHKSDLEPLINQARLFASKDFASDLEKTQSLTDSLLKGIKKINEVYSAFECWLTDIGDKHLKVKDYTSAINVYSSATKLFPKSYLSWSHLAIAYEDTEQYDKALSCYEHICEFDSGNQLALSKIKKLKGK